MYAIAWHFKFHIAAEKILWQTATVVAAGTLVLGLATIPPWERGVGTGKKTTNWLHPRYYRTREPGSHVIMARVTRVG
jgi:hypothetical protein